MEELIAFLGEGLRDTIIEAAFSAVFTAFIILMFAGLTGRWLRRVEVAGVNFEFAAKEAREAYKARNQAPPSKKNLKSTLEGLSGSWDVLWVDDHPEWIRHEMEALSAVGFKFTIARDNAEAEEALRSSFFNLVLSDIGRSDGPSGLAVEALARQLAGDVPLIFYVDKLDGPKTPGGTPVVNTPAALFLEIANRLTRR